MKSLAQRLAQVSLVAALSACTLEMPVSIGATAEQHIHGAPLKTWVLNETQTKALNDWFRKHPTGWSPSYASYAPRVSVRLKHAYGNESSVNFMASGLVVVASIDGQLTQSFDAKAVERLVAIIGATDG
jgi:hypothetical protein